MRRCSRCVLPETFPGVTFDEGGVCNVCRAEPGPEVRARQRARFRAKFEQAIEAGRAKGSSYDGLICYSGGKDSSYTLKVMVQNYGLRVLALVFDNAFLPPVTYENIRAVTDSLGVDTLIVRPSLPLLRRVFLRAIEGNLYSPKTLERASTICTTCIGLVKFAAMRVAVEQDIPLMIFGWSPGQASGASAVFKTNAPMIRKMQEALLHPLEEAIGRDIRPFFLEERHFDKDQSFPVQASPLAILDYDEGTIYREIEELGWRRPQDVDSNSTNCQLNALGNALHREEFKYHPYVFEIAKEVREGILTREEGLSRIEAEDDQGLVLRARVRLGMV